MSKTTTTDKSVRTRGKLLTVIESNLAFCGLVQLPLPRLMCIVRIPVVCGSHSRRHRHRLLSIDGVVHGQMDTGQWAVKVRYVTQIQKKEERNQRSIPSRDRGEEKRKGGNGAIYWTEEKEKKKEIISSSSALDLLRVALSWANNRNGLHPSLSLSFVSLTHSLGSGQCSLMMAHRHTQTDGRTDGQECGNHRESSWVLKR